jgi:hypothetical protein
VAAACALTLFLGTAVTESGEPGWELLGDALSTQRRVGIGTPSPQSALAVKGTITAQELNVTLEGWPDFVFHDNYPLMDLEEIARHVREERRLPGFPSAEEVHEHGAQLGETTRLLVQKAEELTLHLIELKRENARLAERIRVLEARVEPRE